MIPSSRLQEFGFADDDKLPRQLIEHAVTLSLPSALEQGVEPLEVIIDEGLLVPMQSKGSTGGMIIRSDGTMLFVAHQDSRDQSSPLESHFIKDIPYEVRSEVSNIMRRAVQADPSLAGLWERISAVWTVWFPVPESDATQQEAGEFVAISGAWNGIGDILARWLEHAPVVHVDIGSVRVRFVVQCDGEFRKGWKGEELVVDEISRRAVLQQGRVQYLMQRLFPRMQQALRSPMFRPGSVFRLYYCARPVSTVRLVIVPPSGECGDLANSAGIELPLDPPQGFTPSVE
ncbi:MAG: hypothetical protein HGA80_08735 [Candidatus Omnitrophica bacterium]|nr:hypothetical protein [Candidatus Omnitrophota bacterium]